MVGRTYILTAVNHSVCTSCQMSRGGITVFHAYSRQASTWVTSVCSRLHFQPFSVWRRSLHTSQLGTCRQGELKENETSLQTVRTVVRKQHRGRNILERPGVQKIESFDRASLVRYLASQIVHHKDGIFCLSKPVGLGVHPGPKGSVSNQLSLLDVLPDIATLLGEKHLHFIKAPERNCSGVTLLATKPSIAAGVDQLLMKSTAQQTRTRRYWALTIGVPRPGTGTIKVPLAEEQRGNENMVVVKPEASAGSLKRREAKKTSTEYTVLDDNHSCALVEMKPLKAYRHQMQVHMISKLCSILGDHTYSSRIQTVLGIPVLVDVHNVQPCTQVVKKEILHQMNLTAHLMSSVPLHLHCVAITLPKWQNGKDLIITAPLPKYFWKSLKLLDLDRPDVTPELFVSDVR